MAFYFRMKSYKGASYEKYRKIAKYTSASVQGSEKNIR